MNIFCMFIVVVVFLTIFPRIYTLKNISPNFVYSTLRYQKGHHPM